MCNKIPNHQSKMNKNWVYQARKVGGRRYPKPRPKLGARIRFDNTTISRLRLDRWYGAKCVCGCKDKVVVVDLEYTNTKRKDGTNHVSIDIPYTLKQYIVRLFKGQCLVTGKSLKSLGLSKLRKIYPYLILFAIDRIDHNRLFKALVPVFLYYVTQLNKIGNYSFMFTTIMNVFFVFLDQKWVYPKISALVIHTMK